jgi:hypothetical protein
MELLWPLTQPGPLPPLPGSRPIAKEAIARFGFYRRIGVRICHADMRPPFHRQFLRPSLVALLIVLTFMMLALPAQLMSAWAWVPTVGLKVRLMRPGIDGVPSPGIQPVLVHVRFDGTRRSVTVNNEPRTSFAAARLAGVCRWRSQHGVGPHCRCHRRDTRVASAGCAADALESRES